MLKSLLIASVLPMVNPLLNKPDYDKGQQKSSTCASCHGVKGISTNNLVPNLCGQKFEYMVEQMSAYKNASRKNAVMEAAADILTENDTKDILKFFSEQKGCN